MLRRTHHLLWRIRVGRCGPLARRLARALRLLAPLRGIGPLTNIVLGAPSQARPCAATATLDGVVFELDLRQALHRAVYLNLFSLELRRAVLPLLRPDDLFVDVGANFGFWALGGHYHKVVFPTRHNASPPINQLLGVNNAGVAVGFYVDSAGASHPYRYDIFTRTFTVPVAGRASLAATAISNKGTVVGFFSFSTGPTESFLVTNRGVLHTFAKAGASQTLAFGVNDSGEVVGIYTVGVKTYGFTWRLGGHFRTVNDPHGVGTTIINGVNDAGDLVGFYVDSRGNIDGMLATP